MNILQNERRHFHMIYSTCVQSVWVDSIYETKRMNKILNDLFYNFVCIGNHLDFHGNDVHSEDACYYMNSNLAFLQECIALTLSVFLEHTVRNTEIKSEDIFVSENTNTKSLFYLCGRVTRVKNCYDFCTRSQFKYQKKWNNAINKVRKSVIISKLIPKFIKINNYIQQRHAT